jgi:hypothetical protein
LVSEAAHRLLQAIVHFGFVDGRKLSFCFRPTSPVQLRAHPRHTIGPAGASEANVPVRALVGRVG